MRQAEPRNQLEKLMESLSGSFITTHRKSNSGWGEGYAEKKMLSAGPLADIIFDLFTFLSNGTWMVFFSFYFIWVAGYRKQWLVWSVAGYMPRKGIISASIYCQIDTMYLM